MALARAAGPPNLNPKSHPESLQKLCRSHERILLSFETASELILGGLGDLKIIRIEFPGGVRFRR